MARMHPSSLLGEELKESRAEGRVFDALRDGIADGCEDMPPGRKARQETHERVSAL